MIKENLIKKILAAAFVLMLFVGFALNGGYGYISKMFDYLKNYEEIDMDTIEEEFTLSMRSQKDLINLNGRIAKVLNMQGYYSDMGMYVTKDGYVLSASDCTTTDYEYEQIVAFRDFLSENNVNLLYVNAPTKYTDDLLFEKNFGVETYSNRNMDLFLERIGEAGINYIDLRDNMTAENKTCSDIFFKTDHHWTIETGLWATSKVAGGLNDFCGYDIDLSIYNPDNYVKKEWKECWLGEQGRKLAVTYVGLDDFSKLTPTFDTDYIFKSGDYEYEGTFDNFINESFYDETKDVYDADSWYYSYQIIDSVNKNADYGKVLVLGDSYSHAVQPFLSLGVRELDFICLRDFDSGVSIKELIRQNGYDTVVILYAQFMLGARDNPESSNYLMYDFR